MNDLLASGRRDRVQIDVSRDPSLATIARSWKGVAGGRRERDRVPRQTKSRGGWTRALPLEERRVRYTAPMRLGVLSDTHAFGDRRRETLDHVADLFDRARVDLVLHAGDVGEEAVLSRLERVAPVLAVRGNADPLELIETLPDRVWLEIGSRRALLTHGHHGKTALLTAKALAAPDLDLIVFGHSHIPSIGREGATILFNPGSPTERRWNPHFGVGVVAISDDEIAPELILFDDPAHLDRIAF
jgi:putative phosphoesterase